MEGFHHQVVRLQPLVRTIVTYEGLSGQAGPFWHRQGPCYGFSGWVGRRHPPPTPVRPSRARAVSWAAALSISAAPLLRQRFRLRVPSFLQRCGVHALSAICPTRHMRRRLHTERSTDSSASRVQGHAAAPSPAPAAVAAAAPTHTAVINAVVAALVLQACVAAANRRSMLLGKAATHTFG